MGKKKSIGKHVREWLIALGITALTLLVVSHLTVGFYQIKTPDLNAGYQKGDLLWINKWEAGPRLPFSPMHIPFTDFHSNLLTFEYHRFGEIGINQSDIIAFNQTFPDSLLPDRRLEAIARVVGLPGDTIKIHFGKVFVNGKLYIPPMEPILNYSAVVKDSAHMQLLSQRYSLHNTDQQDALHFEFAARPSEAMSLAGDTLVSGFSRMLERDASPLMYPTGHPEQNADMYGPIVIPSRGTRLDSLSENTYGAFLKRDFEDVSFLAQDATMDTVPTFLCDYYFVLSDFRSMGNDSRYFGAIPEYLIIGTIGGVLWQNENADPDE